MSDNEQDSALEAEQSRISRRTLLTTGAASALVGAGIGLGAASALQSRIGTPWPWVRADRSNAPRISGLHLQFGADASSEVVVSWFTEVSVANPRVMLGTPSGGFGQTVQADTKAYRDAKSGTEVRVNHARVSHLVPDTDYIYAAVHDGASPQLGTVRTAPRGRAAFRFTSFGDQSTPNLTISNGKAFTSDSRGSPGAGDMTSAVERIAPLFNLVNGDLCYANLAEDRIRTWSDWFENNSRSARYRPWMPAAGNHENELGNGPVGYGAYQTYFGLPDSGADGQLRGLWYAFTVGGMRLISLNNDDICYQDGGNAYVRGYSGGAQKRWLERELASARLDKSIDWVVVFMHQTAISTARSANGADLAIRQDWLPLFDHYGVDLVLCGHEHHYERSHSVRGAAPNDTLTPLPVSTDLTAIDTTRGTVHLVIGGGGTSVPTNGLLFDTPRCRVITGVGELDPDLGAKRPIYIEEDAPWSAFRDRNNPYGFVAFDVDPGTRGGSTSITATYYALRGALGDVIPVDRFTLTRKRSDAV